MGRSFPIAKVKGIEIRVHLTFALVLIWAALDWGVRQGLGLAGALYGVVFISLLFNQTLLLVFTEFELVALFSASLVAALIAQDGESNWLEGAQLLAVYLVIGLAFFFLPG